MKYFIFDSVQENPIEEGDITREKFIELYSNFPWIEMLEKEAKLSIDALKNSSGIFIRNSDEQGVSVSIVGEVDDYEFYICYKRPTRLTKKKWFRTIEYWDKDYHSIIPQQTLQSGLEACLLLFDKEYEQLENNYG